MRIKIKKYETTRRISAVIILLFCICAAFALQLGKTRAQRTDNSEFFTYAGVQMKESLYRNVLDYYLPIIGRGTQESRSLVQLLEEAVTGCFPVYTYAAQAHSEETDEMLAFEAELEQQLVKQLQEENNSYSKQNGEKITESETLENGENERSDEMTMGSVLQDSFLHQMQGEALAGSSEASLFSYATTKVQQVNLDELADYQTLVKEHYCIDATTGSSGEQLNVEKLLKKDMSIKGQNDQPQILIYHTHSLEGYRDSKAGDLNESVVGLGDYLTELLEERYGYCVLHDRGTYDSDRDRAYGVAGPALEKILKEHPSIEVVIDLHRDGVPEDVYLLTEVNDTCMAPIMFFNGLSYTKTNGRLTALENPNLTENLAFSLQMELLASEYYPGLSRGIYLKGLRYNLHYCPKSLLVEVGAQTNTLQEAMNAMPPLADVLDRALSGEKP